LPNGQYVSLEVAVVDDVVVAAEAAVVAVVVTVVESINSRCIAFRLVVVLLFADKHCDNDDADSTSDSSSTAVLILAPSLPSLTCFVRGGVSVVTALLPNDPNAYTPSVMTTAAIMMMVRILIIFYSVAGKRPATQTNSNFKILSLNQISSSLLSSGVSPKEA